MNLWDFVKKETREEKVDIVEDVDYIEVEFLSDMPVFLGIDLKNHGPFKKGERALIPYDNAKVLEERGVVKILIE